jgi:hypothetical protein
MAVQQALVRLLTTLDPEIEVVLNGLSPEHFDYHAPLMSLPMVLGTTADTIPCPPRYLKSDPARRAFWKDRLSKLDGLKVGLVWAGATRLDQPLVAVIDRRRSIRLDQLAPLAGIEGVSFISLQKGPPADQGKAPPAGMILHDWTEELTDFAETAALIDELDLVISVDTAVAHVAGALGKPIWIMNRFDSCWRWFRDRTDSPWYPSVRLFRQQTKGDWTPVIADVARELAWLADDARHDDPG